MKELRYKGYKVIERKRMKLNCGKIGWTGIVVSDVKDLPDEFESVATVCGYKSKFLVLPYYYRNGNPGSEGERRNACLFTANEIQEGGF